MSAAAAMALGHIHAETELVVPALAESLHDSIEEQGQNSVFQLLATDRAAPRR